MKTILIVGSCLLLILFLFTNCAQIAGGISKKKAAKNIDEFLKKEYKGKLAYKNLSRAFNTATMNPNSFFIHVYNKKNPEIEFYTYIDAKKIVTNKYATSYKIKLEEQYQRIVEYYNTEQKVITEFSNDTLSVDFLDNEIIALNFNYEINAEELKTFCTKFLNRLNESYEILHNGTSRKLLVKTPNFNDGLVSIPLQIEEQQQWSIGYYFLAENLVNAEAFKTKIESNIQAKLDQHYPYYKINEYKKVFLDKSSLSKGAWVQYLLDTRINNEENEKYENPLVGIYIVYFDFETNFIYRGEMLTENNGVISYEEEINKIKKALNEEGIVTE
ncbi:hypothetical protein SAMN04488096_11040 [Mesonia phycicola]|uniref:Uncharacterized protein n=1 Tax=Mesonia phycicola TaxID=579105 RepID=A0A1M6HBJ8_9FLAO|nr:hypothetical protein [Mesonia phycicola]SHJ19494.1 hypothetical protein SAMN04488096_11040 [Mesonia phycicola]